MSIEINCREKSLTLRAAASAATTTLPLHSPSEPSPSFSYPSNEKRKKFPVQRLLKCGLLLALLGILAVREKKAFDDNLTAIATGSKNRIATTSSVTSNTSNASRGRGPLMNISVPLGNGNDKNDSSSSGSGSSSTKDESNSDSEYGSDKNIDAQVGNKLEATCPTNFTFLSDHGGIDDDDDDEGLKINASSAKSEIDGKTQQQQQQVPRVVYQTGPSRCISSGLFRDAVSQFHFDGSPTVSAASSSKEEPSQTNEAAAPDDRLRFGLTENNFWSYRFYDDAALDAYLYNHSLYSEWSDLFPNLAPALRCIEYVDIPVMKADLWRYLVLWESGGIFADLDVRLNPTTFRDELLRDQDAVFVHASIMGLNVPSQWFMAATPKHPIMELAVRAAIDRVLRGKRALPLQHTGPRALYDAIHNFLKANESELGDFPEKNIRAGFTYRNSRTGRSFVVLENGMAKNNAAPSKVKSYELMNVTHYTNKDKGRKYGGKSCYEFLGGTKAAAAAVSNSSSSSKEDEHGIGFSLDGKIYRWYNWSEWQ